MIILKYSPLFIFYYILKPYEIRDIYKSVIFNIILLSIFVQSSNSDFSKNKRYVVKEKKQISSNLSVLDNGFERAYYNLNSGNRNLETSSKFLPLKTVVEKSIMTKEKRIFYMKNDIKNLVEKCGQILKMPYWVGFSALYLKDERTYEKIPLWLWENKKWGKIEENEVLTFNNEIIDSQIIDNVVEKYSKDFNGDSSFSKNSLIENIYYVMNIVKEIKTSKNIEWEDSFIESFKEENTDYILNIIKIGKDFEKDLNLIENINYSGNEIVNSGLNYYWKKFKNLTNKEKKKIVGRFGEVGNKNNFPIFIQGDPVEKISKIQWKFNGNNTTLGTAGCSLYSLCSILHKAGYSNLNIPNTNLTPTMENLSKIFPNGPVIGRYVQNKGYNLQYRQTSTKKGLDELFEDLVKGIPYVVNTKFGKITAYKKDGSTEETIFTAGGHFLILEKGFIKDNKRFVSVIQSSRSYAGTWGLDQNDVLFDYDELINKKILRTSMGTPLPAYTIIGGKNLPTPKYLSNKDFTEEHLQQKEYNWLDGFISKYKINEEKLYTFGSEIEKDLDIQIDETVLIYYKEDSLILFLDSVNAIMIDNLTNLVNIIGDMQPNVILGTTTEKSKVFYITKGEGDVWYKVNVEDIENEVRDNE